MKKDTVSISLMIAETIFLVVLSFHIKSLKLNNVSELIIFGLLIIETISVLLISYRICQKIIIARIILSFIFIQIIGLSYIGLKIVGYGFYCLPALLELTIGFLISDNLLMFSKCSKTQIKKKC